MCHLILLLPALGLPLFWLAPLYVAGPIYAVDLLLSVWLYWLIVRSARQPVETGVERLRREVGRVVGTSDGGAIVCVRNELWKCKCTEELVRGDTVRVVDVDGLTLWVEKVAESDSARQKASTARQTGIGAIS